MKQNNIKMTKSNNLYKIIRTAFLPVFKFVYRPIIVNENYIPKEGAAVIAGNHKHALDPILVDICTKRVVCTLAKKELHDGKLGFFFKAIGTIPVDLNRSDNIRAIVAAMNKIKEGNLVNMSPEAKRNYTDELLLPFKQGAVIIAKKSKCPIIPYSITGDYKLFSKNLKIVFGEPLMVNDMDIESANELLFNEVKELLKQNMDKCELAKKKYT